MLTLPLEVFSISSFSWFCPDISFQYVSHRSCSIVSISCSCETPTTSRSRSQKWRFTAYLGGLSASLFLITCRCPCNPKFECVTLCLQENPSTKRIRHVLLETRRMPVPLPGTRRLYQLHRVVRRGRRLPHRD